jgi:hypothetical protein
MDDRAFTVPVLIGALSEGFCLQLEMRLETVEFFFKLRSVKLLLGQTTMLLAAGALLVGLSVVLRRVFRARAPDGDSFPCQRV